MVRNQDWTYDIGDLNRRQLASMIALVCRASFDRAYGCFEELLSDSQLREHYGRWIIGPMDSQPRFGRRLGWYAVARLMKPKVIVETGIDRGLGSLVLTSALRRNTAEGYPGRYYGLDINPRAGFLLDGEYREFGNVIVGDSISTLSNFEQPIDLFINDSDHAAGYEAKEYATTESLFSEGSIILGDNSHITDELRLFAARTGRKYLFFSEKPASHWYPGAGIGFAFS